MKPIRPLALTVCLMSLLGLAGCGGGGGGGAAHQNTAELAPEVVLLPSDNSVTVKSVTEDSVTLTGAVPALAPGKVLVSQSGDGLMRKVVSVTTDGADTVVETDAAGLPDVFTNADIVVKQRLPLDQFTVLASGQGVTFSPPSAPSRALERTITFNKFTVSTATEGIGGSVEVNGEVTVLVDFEWIYREVNDTVEEVGIKITPAVLSDLTATASIKGEAEIAGVEYLHLQGPIISVPVGPIQIPVRPELKCKAGLKVGGDIGFEMQSTLGFTTTMGVKGVAASTGDLVPQPIFNFVKTGSVEVLKNAYGSAKAELSLVNAELSLLILGVTGPFVTGKALAWEGELRHDTSPRKVTATLSKVNGFTAGVKGEVMGTELFNFETTLAETKETIRTHEFLPGDGNVVIE